MAKTAGRKGQKRRTSRKQTKGGMWPWYLTAVLSIGAALAYDHRSEILPVAAPFYTASIARHEPVDRHEPAKKRAEKRPEMLKSEKLRSEKPKPALAMPKPDTRPLEQVGPQPSARKPGSFYFCTETLENCVVDGGTFWYGRRKIQIADIRAPRIKQAKCDNERKIGSLAKRRLWELLNAGEVQLAAAEGTSGQTARVMVGQGRSVGDMLVSEGLARKRADGKQGWCAEG